METIACVLFSPTNSTEPCVAFSSPARILSKVVFPHPVGPTIPKNSRSLTSRSMPARAWIFPCPVTNSLLNRSEEHTSELQSRLHLVCRLLLEKKNHLRVRADGAAAAGVRTLLGHLSPRRRGPRELLHTASPCPLRRLRLRRPRRNRGVGIGSDRAAVGRPPGPHRRSLGAGRILAHRNRRSVPGRRIPVGRSVAPPRGRRPRLGDLLESAPRHGDRGRNRQHVRVLPRGG